MTILIAVIVVAVPASAANEPSSAMLREDGTLLVDGTPVFPIGIWAASMDGSLCQQFAGMGFNTVINGGDSPESFYDAAAEAGLYVIGSHYLWATFAGHDSLLDLHRHEKAGFDLAFRYRNDLGMSPLESLERYDRKPNVIAWNIFEEPKAAYIEAIEFMYEIFKSNSPGHLVTGISAEKVWYHHFYNCVDVLMVDCYPYRPGSRAQPEMLTYELVAHAKEVMRGKPVWLIAQGGNQWKTLPGYTPLTEDDYRNQAFLGLIAGAKGHILYSYPGIIKGAEQGLTDAQEKEQWRRIGVMVKELNQLAPILCDGRESDSVRLVQQSPNGKGQLPPYRVLEYYGKHYLLIANITTQPIQAQIVGTNYGNPAAFDVTVFCGSSKLQVANGKADAANTVNAAVVGEFPIITVGAGSSGCFEITRRPTRPSAN